MRPARKARLPRSLCGIAVLAMLGISAAPARPAPVRHPAGVAAATPSARPSRDRLERVREALEAERQRLRIPGLAFAVVEDDRVILLEGLGVRSLETREPVDAGTVFPIGSCTKAFTAMAAVISQEDGRLSLDDSPRRYLPWFHMADPEANELVTLRDMLSHRTGLKAYADLAAEPGVLTRTEYLRAAIAAQPAARLRERFQYSNAMVTAVGEIVAKVQGMTWEQVIERRIFAPLGMSDSRATAAELPGMPDHAVGYDDPQHTGVWKTVPPPASLNALAPAGSIASSARDLARWVRFLLAEGTIDGNRVVSAAGVREVMTPHTLFRGSPRNSRPMELWYGLCWALFDWNHHHIVEHNGGSNGISALVSLMPERKLGFVLLINTTPTSLTSITQAGKILWPILLGEQEPAPKAASVPTTASGPDSTVLDTLGRPSPDDLLRNMLAAAGGRHNLQRHATLEGHSRKRYLNQGVEADMRVVWQAPNRLDTRESWTAAGKSIGSLRGYFDGSQAGQETTFGQDAVYTGKELERARCEASLAWLADPHATYPVIRVLGKRRVAGEEAYLVELRPAAGDSILCAVSTRTNLVIQRTSGATVETYSDFRNIGGLIRPFRIAITDQVGESDVKVLALRLDVPVRSDTFAPRRPAVPKPGRIGTRPNAR